MKILGDYHNYVYCGPVFFVPVVFGMWHENSGIIGRFQFFEERRMKQSVVEKMRNIHKRVTVVAALWGLVTLVHISSLPNERCIASFILGRLHP